MTGLTARLGELIALTGKATTAEWLELSERAFTDTVAVLVAGAANPAVDIVAATVDESDGPVLSLATGRRMSVRSAALIDGTSAHALDYDDVDDSLIAHPSAVLVPALFAAGQERDSTGEAVLHAYQTGLEAGRAVGHALDVPRHYGAGWHSTGTIGTIATAAAVSALLGLDETHARHALGIAGSLAGGSRQNFGTMTKPLHVGVAAQQGLTAAYLAERGFTADPNQLEGPLGFLALHRGPGAGDDPVPPADSATPAGLNVKLYPCCYATHAAIEAATRIAATLPRATNITDIDVAVHPGGLAPVIHHRPVNGTQAKFSLEYAVSAALLDGMITLASFDDERVRRPDVQQLLRKVTMTDRSPEHRPRDSAWFAVVTVRTSGGDTRSERVDNPIGHHTRPLSEEQLRGKFTDCLRPATGERLDAAFTALRTLRRQSTVSAVAKRVVTARIGAVT